MGTGAMTGGCSGAAGDTAVGAAGGGPAALASLTVSKEQRASFVGYRCATQATHGTYPPASGLSSDASKLSGSVGLKASAGAGRDVRRRRWRVRRRWRRTSRGRFVHAPMGCASTTRRRSSAAGMLTRTGASQATGASAGSGAGASDRSRFLLRQPCRLISWSLLAPRG